MSAIRERWRTAADREQAWEDWAFRRGPHPEFDALCEEIEPSPAPAGVSRNPEAPEPTPGESDAGGAP